MINTQGFQTIQVTTEEEKHDDTIVTRHAENVQLETDPLSRLYAKVATYTHDDLPRLLFKNVISK